MTDKLNLDNYLCCYCGYFVNCKRWQSLTTAQTCDAFNSAYTKRLKAEQEQAQQAKNELFGDKENAET